MAAMSTNCPENRTLHNFSLPTWGSQKILRCTNPNPPFSEHLPEKKRHHHQTAPSRPETSSNRHRRELFFGDDQIESIREKLIIDLRFEVAKMRAAFLGNTHLASPQKPPPAIAETAEIRPWNLRTRRAACKEPSPLPAPATGDNGESAKFSVALSKEEIEEDFVKMIGKRPPRKAKKRPRFVQRQMDTLFPGLWLPEKITPDLYTVEENPDVRK